MKFKDYVSTDYVGEKFSKAMDDLAPILVTSYGIDPPVLTAVDPFSLFGKAYVTALPVPPFPGFPSLLYFPKFIEKSQSIVPFDIESNKFAPDATIKLKLTFLKFFLNFATDINTLIISQLCSGLVSITTPVVLVPPAMLPSPPGPPVPARPVSVSQASCFRDAPTAPIQIKIGFFRWAVDLIPPPIGIPRLAGKIAVVP